MLTHRNLASNAACAGRRVGLHARRRAAARAADLPRARTLRGHALRAAVGRAHAVAAEVRRARGRALLPRATVMMGVPTFYTRLLAEPAFTRDAARRSACSCRAPRRCSPRRSMPSARAPGTPILERYGMTEAGMITSQSARRRARRRHRRQAAARRRGAHRRRSRRRVRRRGDRRACRCAARTSSPATGACRRRRARNSPPTAFSRPATWASGWPTARRVATCASSAARRTSSSPAASTSIRRRSRSASTRWTAWWSRPSSACPTRISAKSVAAVIVGKPGHTLTEAAIIAALKGEIAHFKVPKRVDFADALPRNAMGKVQKAALREKLVEGRR